MSLTDQFKGLPMESLIAGPLMAACHAQGQLANLTSQFINDVGIDSDENVRMVNLSYDETYIEKGAGEDPDKTMVQKKNISVPFLSIVNIPSLRIKQVTIDFEMEVKQQTSSTQNTEASSTVKVKGNWFVKASFTGSVSTSKQSTRNTDNSAKYTVHVEAVDDGPPEGLSKVLTILSNVITNTNSGEAKEASATTETT